ncbi:MAG: hypothetical protein HOM11_04440 [Methylococcales bacterium]|jgi:hypothetical protein|nr:hypothetical protein [Methylococcales bacterium]MBT7443508.1 hypothetical protein [Methylococcales bacterium]
MTDYHTGILDLSPTKKQVTIQLDNDIVEHIIELKEQSDNTGEFFSVSAVCQKALKLAIIEAHKELGLLEKDKDVVWL